MPRLRFPIDSKDGRPLLSVQVKPSLPQQEALWINAPHQVPDASIKFLLDTGATHCGIDESVIGPWKLTPRGATLVQGISNVTSIGARFDLALRFFTPEMSIGWYHGAVEVSTFQTQRFRGCGFQGVLGMDLLGHTSFGYDLGAREFWLDF